MNTLHHKSKNENDTMRIAELMSRNLKQSMVIFLKGELGAGKTTFVRFLLQSLGYKEKVKSPTYNLVEVHRVGEYTINHFDLYRFGTPEEWFSGGFDEYLSSNSITIIEWPEKIKGIKLNPDIFVEISTDQNNERDFQINMVEEWLNP